MLHQAAKFCLSCYSSQLSVVSIQLSAFSCRHSSNYFIKFLLNITALEPDTLCGLSVCYASLLFRISFLFALVFFFLPFLFFSWALTVHQVLLHLSGYLNLL